MRKQASRCGWVVTGFNVYTQTYMNYVIDLHSVNVPIGVIPVIVMDVCSTLTIRTTLKTSKDYTINMMKELNWNVIEQRFKKSDEIAQAVRT